MKTLRLQKGATVLVERVEIAEGFWQRARGLLGLAGLGVGCGRLLTPCAAVHTLFMRFPLDLIFMDARHCVVRTCWNIRPWRFVAGGRQAQAVLEVESGWLSPASVRTGDQLTIGS